MKVIKVGKKISHDCSRETELLRAYLQNVATLLTDSPEMIEVTSEVGENTTVFTINCPQEFMGQLLGREGRNINSLRHIFISISARLGFRSVIEVPYKPNRY